MLNMHACSLFLAGDRSIRNKAVYLGEPQIYKNEGHQVEYMVSGGIVRKC